MKHYLMSLPMPREGVDMHCYLMTNNRADIQKAINKMMYEIEQRLGDIMLPIVMVTELTPTGTGKVRKVLMDCYPDAGQMLAKADNFHLTVWGMRHDYPPNADLLALH